MLRSAMSITRRTFAGAAILATLAISACAHAPSPAEEIGARFRTVDSNGVKLRVAEMGEGPLVILVHGFPDSWYSWRHQIPALAAAGYHVVAPDMRGYGKSDKPRPVEAYDLKHTTDDLVAIVDAMGEKSAMLVGHDWGAYIGWNAILLHPDRFTAYAAISDPYRGYNPGGAHSAGATSERDDETFEYTRYFEEPDVPEKELDAQPYEFLSRIYLLFEGQTPVEPPEITDPRRSAGGWIPRMGKVRQLPAWLTKEDLDYLVSEFKEAGFRGGVNYYRNNQRNWEITRQFGDATIPQPVIFIAGKDDLVNAGLSVDDLTAMIKPAAKDLRGLTLIPGAGHWVQQEKPQEVNALLLDFFKSVKK